MYPTDWRDLKADSLPDPGPETSTLNVLSPYSFALLPTSSAAIWAAKGVDLQKSSIRLPDGTLKELGEYSIDIELHPEVIQGVKVVIAAKEEI